MQLDELTADQLIEIREEKTTSLAHGNIAVTLSANLHVYTLPKKLGMVFDSQTTFKVVGKPPTRQPDVAFVIWERLPDELGMQADFAPDLAVEVVSESDMFYDLERKIEQYRQSQVKLIWLIRPYNKLVEVYHEDSSIPTKLLTIEDELDGEDVVQR